VSNDAPIRHTKEQSPKGYSNYRTLIVILSGPGLALIILLVGVALLVLHFRKNHGLYSRRSSTIGSGRVKRSSTILTNSDIGDTPVVLYTRLKPSQITLTDNDTLLPFDNSIPINSETVELLSSNQIQIINNDNGENIYYSTLN
jgi:hypothetical protein